MEVRRMVRECIRAGVAGIRIDDQPIEGKRKTQSAGVEVVPLDQAIARYRAAIDMKNELDLNFVVMAQCYAHNASGGTLDDCGPIASRLALTGYSSDGVEFFVGKRGGRDVFVHTSVLNRAGIANLAEGQRVFVIRADEAEAFLGVVEFYRAGLFNRSTLRRRIGWPGSEGRDEGGGGPEERDFVGGVMGGRDRRRSACG